MHHHYAEFFVDPCEKCKRCTSFTGIADHPRHNHPLVKAAALAATPVPEVVITRTRAPDMTALFAAADELGEFAMGRKPLTMPAALLPSLPDPLAD